MLKINGKLSTNIRFVTVVSSLVTIGKIALPIDSKDALIVKIHIIRTLDASQLGANLRTQAFKETRYSHIRLVERVLLFSATQSLDVQ